MKEKGRGKKAGKIRRRFHIKQGKKRRGSQVPKSFFFAQEPVRTQKQMAQLRKVGTNPGKESKHPT